MKSDLHSRRLARTLALAVLAINCVALSPTDTKTIDWRFDITSIDSDGVTFDANPDRCAFCRGDFNDNNFDLQTETVPETASALLFSVSAIWSLFHRPRRATS